MVEFGAVPCGRRVTGLASRREPCRYVVRICCLIEIRLVAPNAVCRRALVLSVQVALRASDILVSPGQHEAGCRMIELGAVPCGCRVTGLAGGWKPGRHVTRVRGLIEIVLVTTDAGRRSAGILAVDVALSTLHRLVSAGQSEAGACMIERRRLPLGRCVTRLASRREARNQVVRVFRVVEISLVTRNTIGGQPLVDTVGVTLRALHRGVRPCQRKCRG